MHNAPLHTSSIITIAYNLMDGWEKSVIGFFIQCHIEHFHIHPILCFCMDLLCFSQDNCKKLKPTKKKQ